MKVNMTGQGRAKRKIHTYKWSGESIKTGNPVTGELEAANKEIAEMMIRRFNVRKVKIKKQSPDIEFLSEKIKPKDITIFFRQLSVMLDAGLPLVQGFELAENGSDLKPFKKLLKDVREQIETGSTMSDSLAAHPDYFDRLTVSLIKAGEDGGILDSILLRICTYQEKSNSLKGKIKSAMVYPIAIITISFIVTAILMIFVIPVFAEMFSGFGAALPYPTQVVMNISNLFVAYWYVVFGTPILGIFLFKQMHKKSESFRYSVDKVLLNLPIIGDIIRKGAVAKFCRTFATLDASGVPILDALDTVATTSGNLVIEGVVRESKASIVEGNSLSQPLIDSEIFPSMVTQMIAIGEKSGSLESMLSKIADFYEEEVDVAVDGLTTLIEPVIMSFLGVVIGGLVIAMYLPIFQMASNIN